MDVQKAICTFAENGGASPEDMAEKILATGDWNVVKDSIVTILAIQAKEKSEEAESKTRKIKKSLCQAIIDELKKLVKDEPNKWTPDQVQLLEGLGI